MNGLELPGLFNYWAAIVLLVIGLIVVIDSRSMVKKMIGLNMFQAAVFLFFITSGKMQSGVAPILGSGTEAYSNPLPHVLILTAIVVGVATTAVGLALVARIRLAYNTVHEDEIADKPQVEPEILPR